MPAIPTASALRHDPLQTQLARLGEYERSLGYQGVTEQYAADAVDDPRKLVSPFLKRALTEVRAIEAQEIECDKSS